MFSALYCWPWVLLPLHVACLVLVALVGWLENRGIRRDLESAEDVIEDEPEELGFSVGGRHV